MLKSLVKVCNRFGQQEQYISYGVLIFGKGRVSGHGGVVRGCSSCTVRVGQKELYKMEEFLSLV